MKLGFVSAILADLSFEEVVPSPPSRALLRGDALLAEGQGRAPLRRGHPHRRRLPGRGGRAADPGTLAAKKVGISALGYYPNPLDPDPGQAQVFVEHIRKVIAAAARLGLSNFNTFIGRDPAKPWRTTSPASRRSGRRS